jgi:hypothetical protein
VGFIESIADFGNPIVVGGQYSVLSTDIFFAIVGAQYDQGKAASLAWILTLFALAVFALQRGLLGKQNYTTVSGKGDAGIPMACPTACAAAQRVVYPGWRSPWWFTCLRLPVVLYKPGAATTPPLLPTSKPPSGWSGASLVWSGRAQPGIRFSPRSSWPGWLHP